MEMCVEGVELFSKINKRHSTFVREMRVVNIKSTVKSLSISVAFLENMNFRRRWMAPPAPLGSNFFTQALSL